MMMVMAGIFGVVLMAVLGTYYFRNKKRHRKTALFCKALATSVSGLLLLGYLYGARTGESAGGVLSGWADGVILEAAFAGTLAAIVFYMAADVLLECRFIWGAVCFGIGHICMAAGFLLSGESVLHPEKNGGYTVDTGLFCLALAVFAALMASACAALHRYFHSLKKKKLFYPLLAYVLILSLMAALAVTAGGLIPAAGGLCFAVSDVLLGRNRLGKRRSAVCGAFVLILYYAAVYLFAMRLWI
ncbi:lysoplasmalogenase family protein [Mediterraneibacter glycyrrhizinilyticus]|uniref:Lysoplasmalogenase n=1 Tax=Candidatus Mediterraneibacter faecipullorum TaxID=2838670 RepID=A0A9D2NKH9_9FIRM|nr:lysoplasmalogenase family protein [Mediterraneibacter glycyrrhizinilyticus]MDM8125787.1 lysoplasmalogenase family protein [Mediterraneibacter glycyrrhizinilyticus]HJC33457.1 lysoplasmalogenase [Candidatus Mediterraneibacter faecipullorum]